MTGRRGRSGGRDYPRTARLNELLREIVAEALAEVDDPRLENVSITSVDVDRDLNRAVVRFDALAADDEADAAVAEALAAHRVALQAAIGRQARIRRTPTLAFRPDEAVRSGERIEAVLHGLAPTGEATEAGNPDQAGGEGEPDGEAGAGADRPGRDPGGEG